MPSSLVSIVPSLPPFYQQLYLAWKALDGGLADGDVLSVKASSDCPLSIGQLSSRITYALLRDMQAKRPHCEKFLAQYGAVHWPQTWSQLHLCNLDRNIVDVNWQIAHGVLYTGARLAHRFHMAHIDPLCFCRADDETLEHLFCGCELARLFVAWVFFNLQSIDPTAGRFTVDELLFGFSANRRRAISSIFVFMLLVMKHTIWVARCDYRFRQKMPVASLCLKTAISKIKFVLGLLGRRCRSVGSAVQVSRSNSRV